MIFLRSLLFNVALWCWTAGFGLLCSPALLSAKCSRPIPFYWIDGSLWLLKHICGLRYEIRGRQYLTAEPTLYIAKHQSALDTLVLWKELGGPAFILKRELLRIPVFGWYLWRVGNIAIDRSDGDNAIRSIGEQAAYYVKQGRSVLIFPEGTRTPPGQTVRYKTRGILALGADVLPSITPIALNAGLFWARNAFIKRPGVAVFELLDTVPNQQSREQIYDIKRMIEQASKRLL